MNNLTKPIEEIRWIDADDELPNTIRRVMMFIPSDSNPVWFGYYSPDNGWCTVGGFDLSKSEMVIAWAECPKGPGKNEVED